MRVIALIVGIISLPGLLFGAQLGKKVKDDEKNGAGKEEAKKQTRSVAKKPEIRTVQVKSGVYLFSVTLDPGVPDPGQVVEVSIELAEVPPVPDPIYGERIPVKDAVMTAKVTDADGAGYTLDYRVHTMEDAGTYGFHFTPLRKDNYRLALVGTRKGKKYNAGIRVPVGIWPFKKVDAQGNVSTVAAKAPSSRLPAMPSGMKTPAVPSGTGAAKTATRKQRSKIEETMQELGKYFAQAGMALLAGRRADLKESKKASAGMLEQAKKASGLTFDDSEYSTLVGELINAIKKLDKAAAAGRGKAAVKAFEKVGSHHCNRCHFKMRWHMIEHSSAFENQLP